MNLEPLLNDIERIKKREKMAKKSIIDNIDNVISLLQSTQYNANNLESLDPKLEVFFQLILLFYFIFFSQKT